MHKKNSLRVGSYKRKMQYTIAIIRIPFKNSCIFLEFYTSVIVLEDFWVPLQLLLFIRLIQCKQENSNVRRFIRKFLANFFPFLCKNFTSKSTSIVHIRVQKFPVPYFSNRIKSELFGKKHTTINH